MGTVLEDLQGIREAPPERGNVLSDLESIRSGTFKPPPEPSSQIVHPQPSTTEKILAGAGDIVSEAVKTGKATANSVLSDLEKIRIPGGAQFLLDFMHPSLAISDAIARKLSEPGTAEQAQTLVFGLPGVMKDVVVDLVQHPQDALGAAALEAPAAVSGMTVGAVDLVHGQLGIPFTNIKTKPLYTPLPEALKQLGVSPEVADSKAPIIAGELIGSVAPWEAISSALSGIRAMPFLKFGGLATTEAPVVVTKSFFGQELTKAAEQGLTGAIIGGARVRDPNENIETNILYGATLGAGGSLVLGTVPRAVAKFVGEAKLRPLVELKDEIANVLYKSGQMDNMEAAEKQASRIVVHNIAEAGGISKVDNEKIIEATKKLRSNEFLAKIARPVELPPGSPITPEAPPPRPALPQPDMAPEGPVKTATPPGQPLPPEGAISLQPEPEPPSPPPIEPKKTIVRGQPKISEQPAVQDTTKGLAAVADRKATMPILSQIHVKDGVASSTDLEVGLQIKTDKPNGMYQVIGQTMEKSPLDPMDFPSLPEKGEVVGSLDRGDFINNLERAARSTSTDEYRSNLMGVNLRVESGKATLIATDGRQLSESPVIMPKALPDGDYNLPSPKRLAAGLKSVSGETLSISILKHENGRVLFLEGDNGRAVTKLIEGKFPTSQNIAQVRPTINQSAWMSRDEAMKALKDLAPYLKANKATAINLKVTDKALEMTVSGKAGEKTVAVSVTVKKDLAVVPRYGTIVMPVKNDTQDVFSLSSDYLRTALKAVNGDNLHFGYSTNQNALHFYGADTTQPKFRDLEQEKVRFAKKGKAPAGAASVGLFADIEAPPAAPTLTAEEIADDLPPVIELPELVQIAKDLLGGKLPEVHENLRAASGEAFGVFHYTEQGGKISLKASIFGDGSQAVKTLAHEIGHLIDWLPDMTLKRGNVLGHLLALKKYMAGTFGDLYKAAEIRAELKNMTHIWKPFDPAANKNYASYRYRASELYADAVSVFFNNPGLLRQTAPKFFKGFMDELDRRPEVKKVYTETVEAIKNGGILRLRDENLQAMYAKGEAQAMAERQAAQMQYRSMIENLRYEIIDRNEAIIKRVAGTGEIDPSDNPIYALEEMNYSSSEAKAWVSSNDAIIGSLKDAGLNWQDLGDLLFHERVIGDPTRAEQANPLGFTPKTSTAQIDFMLKNFGPRKFNVLQKAADDFRANWKYVVDRLEQSHMLDPETIGKIKSNPYYVTFDVFEKHITSSYGPSASPRIFKSVGTLKEITNPATATIMKGIAMIKAINRNIAGVKVVNFLSQNFGPSEIKPAETKWNGRFHEAIEPREAHKGMVTIMEGGRLRSFYVDEYVAKSFEKNPREARAIIDVLAYTNRFFRSVFVQKNPGFQLFNLIRDFKRAYKNTPGIGARELVNFYIKSMQPAYRKALGFTDPLVKEMLEKKMLITVETKWGLIKEDESIAAIVARYNENPQESKSVLLRPFKRVFDRLGTIGEAIEFMPKIAGYQYLREHQAQLGLSDEVIGHMIRGQIGSPDFLRQGGGYSIYNQIFLFSNSIKEGWRSDAEVVSERPAEYLWKTAKLNLIPKLLMYAAAVGYMGYGVKKIFDGMSEYDKSNYLTIPIGVDANGKSVYMRVPEDETGRFLGGLLWKIMGQGKNKDIADLFSFMAGQAPTLTPSLMILESIMQYASGQNPYDFYRGRNAMPDTVFQAKDWHTRKEFAKYLANMGGLGIIYRFDTNKITPIKSELEKIIGLPIIDNIVGRFIKVSDYGEYEDAKQVVTAAQAQEARMRLNEQDALSDHINAADKPNMNDMVKLYFDMRKNGLLERGIKSVTIQEFKKSYDMASQKKTGDIYVDAMIFLAKTTPEKAALLAHYQLILPKDQYQQVFRRLLTTREIGPQVLILADQINKGPKK